MQCRARDVLCHRLPGNGHARNPHAMPCFRNWLMEMALGILLIGRDRSDRVFVLLQVIRMLAVGIN